MNLGLNLNIDRAAGVLYWTPANITTSFWVDASDASTITESGGLVSQWDDKSGNNNHAYQDSGASQPTLIGTQVDFDGSNDILKITNDPFKDIQNPCIILLGKWDSSSEWSNAFASWHGEGTGWQLRQRSASFDKVTFTIQGTAGTLDPDPSSTTQTSFFISSAYRTSASTRTIRHNGTQTYIDTGDTGTINYTGSDKSGIGGRWTADSWASSEGYLNGSIKEIIVADGLTDGDIEKLEGYLAWKWGLEGSLPLGHPYKTSAPLA